MRSKQQSRPGQASTAKSSPAKSAAPASEDVKALHKLVVYAAEEAKSLNAPLTEALLRACMKAIQTESAGVPQLGVGRYLS